MVQHGFTKKAAWIIRPNIVKLIGTLEKNVYQNDSFHWKIQFMIWYVLYMIASKWDTHLISESFFLCLFPSAIGISHMQDERKKVLCCLWHSLVTFPSCIFYSGRINSNNFDSGLLGAESFLISFLPLLFTVVKLCCQIKHSMYSIVWYVGHSFTQSTLKAPRSHRSQPKLKTTGLFQTSSWKKERMVAQRATIRSMFLTHSLPCRRERERENGMERKK